MRAALAGLGGEGEPWGCSPLPQKGSPSPPQTPPYPLPRLSTGGEAARREFVPPGGKGETKAVCGVLLSFQGKTEGTLRRV